MRTEWKKLKRSTAGVTLVELIVTFALISIFLTSATLIMGTYFRIFSHAREYGNQKTLATTLMDTIEYEIGLAEAGTYQYATGAENEDITRAGVEISADNAKVYFKNQDSIPIEISLDNDGYLQILYQKITKDADGNVIISNNEPDDWYYGKGVYNNNKIKTLTFSPGTSKNNKSNFIKVTLELENKLEPEITYTLQRIVRCYNLSGDQGNDENTVHKETT